MCSTAALLPPCPPHRAGQREVAQAAFIVGSDDLGWPSPFTTLWPCDPGHSSVASEQQFPHVYNGYSKDSSILGVSQRLSQRMPAIAA